MSSNTITTKDATEIYYKDWGKGPVVTFSHGWPLSSDAWDGQMLFLVQNGFRVVAHDRRGHGRSSQASSGNDMDGYADDLGSRDRGARSQGRHARGPLHRWRRSRPLHRAPWNEASCQGCPHRGCAADHVEVRRQSGGPADGGVRQHAEWPNQGPLAILQGPGDTFYGANRPGAKVSQGMLDQFWLWSMQAGLKNAYESIKAFSETDFTEDLKKIDVPTLVMHGEDDQIVPVKDSAVKSARLIKGAKEIYYPGAPHGLTATHQDKVNADLLAFLRS